MWLCCSRFPVARVRVARRATATNSIFVIFVSFVVENYFITVPSGRMTLP
jgi:hypothetical protein